MTSVVLVALLGLFNNVPQATGYDSMEACNAALNEIAMEKFQARETVDFGTNRISVNTFDNYYCIKVN